MSLRNENTSSSHEQPWIPAFAGMTGKFWHPASKPRHSVTLFHWQSGPRSPKAAPMDRHYGLDWLRIGAFGLLIFYHIGMVFVPWDYHVKLAADDWVVVPMLATNAWRLMLLFVVSGYASRALMIRSDGLAAFARNRSVRLLVPLAFGIAVIVPPQVWAYIGSGASVVASSAAVDSLVAFLSIWLCDPIQASASKSAPSL